jgi:hypothetical protein
MQSAPNRKGLIQLTQKGRAMKEQISSDSSIDTTSSVDSTLASEPLPTYRTPRLHVDARLCPQEEPAGKSVNFLDKRA